MTKLEARPVGRPRGGHGQRAGSTSSRILELLDALWGEWIDLDSLVTEYLDRFDGNEDTVRRKFYQLLKDPPSYIRMRWVPSKGDHNKNPYRQLFIENPYAREESDHDHAAA
jgi:hypothetical protein